VKAEDGTPFKS